MLCVSFTQRRLYVATNLGSNYSSENSRGRKKQSKVRNGTLGHGKSVLWVESPSQKKKAAVRYPNAEVNPEKQQSLGLSRKTDSRMSGKYANTQGVAKAYNLRAAACLIKRHSEAGKRFERQSPVPCELRDLFAGLQGPVHCPQKPQFKCD